MIKILKYLKPYIFPLIILIILIYIQVQTDLALPDYSSKIINQGIIQENTDFIKETGVQMLLVSLLGAVATIIAGYLASIIATGFAKDIRLKVFKKVETFSMVEFDKFTTASLITRTTNDIQQIQMVLFMILRMVLSAPIMGIGAIINATNKAPSMSWLIALAVATLLTVIITLFSFSLPKFKKLQKLVDKLNAVSREFLTGIRVIRAFNKEKFEEDKFDKVNKDLTKINLFVNRLMVIMQPIMMLIFNLTTLGIIWVGASLINTKDLMIGDMMAFMQYAMQVIMSFLMISIVFILIPRASVSANRIVEVLDTTETIKDPQNPKSAMKVTKGVIEFRKVCFSYPNSVEPVLKDISFRADIGEVTAIIGSTGCGKSTLINLIPRFYDATEGEVLIDNVNVKDMKQSELRDKIGFVPQRGILFSGTIESNIKYGKNNATKEEVLQAAKISQALEFIDKFPEKFQSEISEGGINVSGGQKQRLAIARAVITDPEIYIFDDSFSALDFKTDRALRNALKQELKNSAVLIVTQRISTIMDADKIIVLDEGRIVGIGKHTELMRTCKVYEEIANSQLPDNKIKNKNVEIRDNLPA